MTDTLSATDTPAAIRRSAGIPSLTGPRRVAAACLLLVATMAASLGAAATAPSPAGAYDGQSYSVTGYGGRYAKVWGTVKWLRSDQVQLYHGIKDLTTDGRNAEAWIRIGFSNGYTTPWMRFDVSGSTSNVYRTWTSPRYGVPIDGVQVLACRSTGSDCGFMTGWIWR